MYTSLVVRLAVASGLVVGEVVDAFPSKIKLTCLFPPISIALTSDSFPGRVSSVKEQMMKSQDDIPEVTDLGIGAD